MEEIHLFIVWQNARYKEKEIFADIATRFTILGIHEVCWKKEKFSKNLTRFYGENLPPHSGKEKHCGNGAFKLIVVKDETPMYRIRNTSKGAFVVNVNMFDAKEMYRKWTGGGHKIHGTNDEDELCHDLIMLTGMNKNDYLEKVKQQNRILDMPFTYMVGENGWKDMQQILYVMNETLKYVVLRNYKDIFTDYSSSVHGDVDILVNDYKLAVYVLNATPTHISKRRVQYKVKIGNGGTFFDVRFIGDDYYCKKWEQEILSTRVFAAEGFYHPDDENYYNALLYHALIHKPEIAPDYKMILQKRFATDNEKVLKNILFNYLNKHGYTITVPYDYSVYFNSIMTTNISTRQCFCRFIYRLFDYVEGMCNVKK